MALGRLVTELLGGVSTQLACRDPSTFLGEAVVDPIRGYVEGMGPPPS